MGIHKKENLIVPIDIQQLTGEKRKLLIDAVAGFDLVLVGTTNITRTGLRVKSTLSSMIFF